MYSHWVCFSLYITQFVTIAPEVRISDHFKTYTSVLKWSNFHSEVSLGDCIALCYHTQYTCTCLVLPHTVHLYMPCDTTHSTPVRALRYPTQYTRTCLVLPHTVHLYVPCAIPHSTPVHALCYHTQYTCMCLALSHTVHLYMPCAITHSTPVCALRYRTQYTFCICLLASVNFLKSTWEC